MNSQGNLTAAIVHVIDAYKVVINRGLDQGVKAGDTYLIYSIGPELIDPETNEALGNLEIVKGRAIVRHVQDKVSTLETIEIDETPGRRKVIKRDGGHPLLSFSLNSGTKEEIEEGPTRSKRPLNSEEGDLAKLIASK